MEDLVINERLTIPANELRIAFARSSGPGGQNVNKVASKVELRWAALRSDALTDADRAWLKRRLARRLTSDGDLIVTSSQTRDQSRNRVDARRKLKDVIARALERPRPRKRTRPSRAATERRLTSKRHRARRKAQRAHIPDD